jgi:hypothetical protein
MPGPTYSFVYTWNSAYLATPADTEDRSLGAQRIRDTKAGVGERFAVNHSLNGDAYDGMHTVVQLQYQPSDPTPNASGSSLYTKTGANSKNELFFQDNAGEVTQITAGGALNQTSVIPSGTNMLFLQATVPVGWTLNSSFTDRVIRVATGGTGDKGGQTGGSWNIAGVTIGGTSLTISQLPPHSHTIAQSLITASGFAGGGGTPFGAGSVQTGSQGAGAAHSHGFSNDGTWRPSYANVIVGTKN